MCLFISDVETEAFKAKYPTPTIITCYKGFLQRGDGKLFSPFRGKRYKVGINRSNRWFKRLSSIERNLSALENGVYVWASKDDAEAGHMHDSATFPLIKVECNTGDFVAADCDGILVFMKIRISQEEYDKATGGRLK